MNPRFVINATENECNLVPGSATGSDLSEIAFLACAGRDKARDVETSVLARGTVQPAWITPLYTWEYNTRGNVHSGDTVDLRHPGHLNLDMNHFFYHAHRQINEDFRAIISASPSLPFSLFFSFKGGYRGFIALKEIQIRFATVQILNRGGSGAMRWWSEEERVASVAPRRHQMAAEVFTWHPAAWLIWPASNSHGQNFSKTPARGEKTLIQFFNGW